MDWEKELADGLKSAGKDNLGTESVDEAMESIARPIALAIKRNSSNILIVGTATCDEINVLVGMSSGDVWAIKDSGIINNPYGMSLDVSAGDLIRFDGEKWELFFHLELTNYITSDVFDYSVKTLRDAIEINSNGIECLDESLGSHLNDSDNPHGVTSDQLNAVSYGLEQELDEAQRKIARDNISVYSKKQIDDFIKNWSGYVVIPYGSSLPAVKDAQLGKIYLVQKTNDPDIKDKYEEWISDGNAWSLIGDMSIDLSGYVRFDNIADSSTSGVVKSSDSDGKVSVDSSGVMSVNGWGDKADDSGVVHKAVGSSTEISWRPICALDSSNDSIYDNNAVLYKDSSNGSILQLGSTTQGVEASRANRGEIRLANKTGYKVILCPSDTTASSVYITFPTTGGTLALDGDVVHKTGEEVISGKKTFNNDVYLTSNFHVATSGGRILFDAIDGVGTGYCVLKRSSQQSVLTLPDGTHTLATTDDHDSTKQNVLTAGENISIDTLNCISATDTTYSDITTAEKTEIDTNIDNALS